ncbi:hypothetical protein Pcinc_035870 [Petrolisthes cinctipes]|uniref:Sodium-coupled monocarboxylate transporter 1 n=1 Tax=Petrolisthes cinctipes TaxID=88211 RepID=A0AAE1EMJ2_PETCI|nr:hypothetical protein Pcinc_035870 [Petrolisthes cinctipes]
MALGIVDIVLLVISLMCSAAIGVYYGIKGIRSTPLEYLLGGRSMKPLPLSLSLMVGTISAITIVGSAGEMYAFGTQLWMMDVGILFGLVIIAKVFIPILYPLKMVSLYEYVERRFKSRWLRKSTVFLQLLGGYMFIGFLLFPPSIALQFITGLHIVYNILIIGGICTLYSTFGGVKAVVYTDALQSLVMVAGVLAIVIQGCITHGGMANIIDTAYHHQRIEFFNMNLNPYQRHSLWLCVINGFFFTLGTYGVNQSQTQRYFSTASVKHAQRVLYYAAVGMVLMRALINLSGLVMFANYVGCDPITHPTRPMTDPSQVAIFYVNTELPKIPGLAGLFVAAVYAAVLSSVSTQLNSMTALVWEDFLKELAFFKGWTDVKVGYLQKILVLGAGVLGMVLGLVVWQLGWSFFRTVLAINGALSGPLIGLFLIAVFLPWVNTKGASIGFIVSIILNVIMAIGQLTMPKAPYLPLSRENCPLSTPTNMTLASLSPITNLTDSTLSTLSPLSTVPSTSLDFTTTTISATMPATTPESPPGEWLFGLSYCLNPLWGTLFSILISIIVTAITGMNRPEDIDRKLIAPPSWEAFQRPLSQLFTRRKRNQASTDDAEHGDNQPLREGSPPAVAECKEKEGGGENGLV